MRTGFDNDKYLKIQSEHIKERIGKFGDKLYLEFGGKLFDDYHASRVLPGFQPDSKLQMLMQLSDVAEIVIVISAADIEKNKVRGDLGITYDVDVLRLIGEFEKKGLYVGSVVITKFTGQNAAVQFQMIEDTLLVVQPVSNGPSEKVGILAGDRIIAVNDSAIAGVKMSTEDIMSRLRGEKGSEVKLTIVRRGVNDPLFFTVKRDKIPILSLDAAYMIQPRTGYIRINRFGATTAEEFLKALKELQKKGMKDLILDLQGNGGGYLNAAIDLANEFLQQKDLIVYTEVRAAFPRHFRLSIPLVPGW